MTIESILEEFEKYFPNLAKAVESKEVCCVNVNIIFRDWLTQKLIEYRNSVIDECIGVVPKQQYGKVLGARFTTFEENAFNKCCFQTIGQLNKLKEREQSDT